MDISLAEAKQISQEAYVFFRSVVDQYRLKTQVRIPENLIVVQSDTSNTPLGFTYQCRDQLYGNAYLNLFTEPLVLGVPQIPSNMFFSAMFVDQYANNFAYFGTVNTGNDSANYLIAGPNWKGTVPAGIRKKASTEGNYAIVVLRLEVKNPEDPSDVDETADLLKSCTLQPLSTFTGEQAPPQVEPPDLPAYEDDALHKPSYFKYVNAFTTALKIFPTEEKLYAKFARIGISPGAPFPAVWMDDSLVEAISQGIWEGNKEVESEFKRQSVVNKIGGWLYLCGIKPPLIGSREVMRDRYLARAGMAVSSFEWGNDIQQAIYMQTFEDLNGNALEGGTKYLLHWKENEQPQVQGYWSVTLYDKVGYLVQNDLNRNSISNNTPGLVYHSDGSLTIYIQDTDPGGDKSSNWLPSPSTGTEFQLFLRCYWPKDIFFHGTYSPPLARKKLIQ